MVTKTINLLPQLISCNSKVQRILEFIMQQKTCQKLLVSLQKPTIKPVKLNFGPSKNIVLHNALLHPEVSDLS